MSLELNVLPTMYYLFTFATIPYSQVHDQLCDLCPRLSEMKMAPSPHKP